MDALYYESHVTVDPCPVETLQGVVIDTGYKIAKLYMDKQGTAQISDMDMFMTAHSKNLDDIKSKMDTLVTKLKANDLVVRRFKIEAVIIDSRQFRG